MIKANKARELTEKAIMEQSADMYRTRTLQNGGANSKQMPIICSYTTHMDLRPCLSMVQSLQQEL